MHNIRSDAKKVRLTPDFFYPRITWQTTNDFDLAGMSGEL